jgi:hypothetical protein
VILKLSKKCSDPIVRLLVLQDLEDFARNL